MNNISTGSNSDARAMSADAHFESAGKAAQEQGNATEEAQAQMLVQGLKTYQDVIAQIERMHRLLLDVIKDEFARTQIHEINPVQGLLLYNIGVSELSAGELRSRGYYQGSNVSYNLRKLVDADYMHYERSEADRRSVRVKLTEKGRAIHEVILKLFARLYSELLDGEIWTVSDCQQTRDNLLLLERYWTNQIRYIY